jgi:hypothetical protein
MNGAALLTIVADEREAAPTALPPLPIEGNLVAAVRALEAAKHQAEQALFLLQFAPRNAVEVFNVLGTLQGTAANAANAYDGYQQILHCQGQA